jgi:DNA-binding transcriptional MerR regulator
MRPGQSPLDRARAARSAIRSTTLNLARQAGTPIITRPITPGSGLTIQDLEPLTGVQAARELELASRYAAGDYIRQAREAGCTWHDIGTAMQLKPGQDAQQAGSTLADAAFTYAADPDSHYARTYGPSITWTCTTCTRHITDQGPDNHPADNERGHTPDCPRLQATIDAWNAECETDEARREPDTEQQAPDPAQTDREHDLTDHQASRPVPWPAQPAVPEEPELEAGA